MNNSTDLIDLPLHTEICQLPLIGAVYFLFYSEELVYVGQSKSLRSRIIMHSETRKIPFTGVRFIEVDGQQERLLLEHSCISRYQPKYNKANITQETAEMYERSISERGIEVKKPRRHPLSRKRHDEPDYILFNCEDRLTRELQRATSSVLFCAFKYVNSDNEILLPAGIKNRIALELGMDANVVDQNLSKLCKAEILKRIDGGLYFVNPNVARHPEFYE